MCAAALLAACSASRSVTIADGSKWNLQWVKGFEGTMPTDPEECPYIVFNTKKGMFHSRTGCNIFNGDLTIDGESIKFGDGPMTKAMCNDEGLEIMFVQNILKANKFKADNNTVTLYVGNEKVITLTASK